MPPRGGAESARGDASLGRCSSKRTDRATLCVALCGRCLGDAIERFEIQLPRLLSSTLREGSKTRGMRGDWLLVAPPICESSLGPTSNDEADARARSLLALPSPSGASCESGLKKGSIFCHGTSCSFPLTCDLASASSSLPDIGWHYSEAESMLRPKEA